MPAEPAAHGGPLDSTSDITRRAPGSVDRWRPRSGPIVQLDGAELGFAAGSEGRDALWRRLSEASRQRVHERSGDLIEWWAHAWDVDGESRVYAVALGNRGLSVLEPRVGDRGQKVSYWRHFYVASDSWKQRELRGRGPRRDGIAAISQTTGEDAIRDWLTKMVRDRGGFDAAKDSAMMARLNEAARKANSELSSARSTTVSLPYIVANGNSVFHIEEELTRTALEDITRSFRRSQEGSWDAFSYSAPVVGNLPTAAQDLLLEPFVGQRIAFAEHYYEGARGGTSSLSRFAVVVVGARALTAAVGSMEMPPMADGHPSSGYWRLTVHKARRTPDGSSPHAATERGEITR